MKRTWRERVSGVLAFTVLCCCGIAGATTEARVRASEIKDISGVTRYVPAKKSRATVLLFITTDCPIANSYAPEINRICKQYEPEQITFYIVYTDPTIPLKDQRKHRKDFGYRCPALRDSKHALAYATGVTVTPEVAVLSPDGALLYRGRIDDRYLDFGKKRTQATTHDLRDALDAIVRGKPIPNPTTKAVGCFIPTHI
jgi:hypothetical protein